MDTMLFGASLVILSSVALVAVIGAFGIKFIFRREDKKIEITISDDDNLNLK